MHQGAVEGGEPCWGWGDPVGALLGLGRSSRSLVGEIQSEPCLGDPVGALLGRSSQSLVGEIQSVPCWGDPVGALLGRSSRSPVGEIQSEPCWGDPVGAQLDTPCDEIYI